MHSINAGRSPFHRHRMACNCCLLLFILSPSPSPSFIDANATCLREEIVSKGNVIPVLTMAAIAVKINFATTLLLLFLDDVDVDDGSIVVRLLCDKR